MEPDRLIRLKLFAETVAFADRQEVFNAFRHRYLIAHYLAFSVKVLVLAYLLSLSEAPIGVLYPAILIGIAVAFWVGVACLALGLRLVGTPCDRRARTVRMEPALLCAGIAFAGAIHVVSGGIDGTGIWTIDLGIPLFLFTTLYLFLAVTFLMRRPIPRALRRMREDRQESDREDMSDWQEHDALQGAGETEADAAPEAGEEEEADSPDRAALAAVLRLQADGNYVTVVTERGRMSVPGPFAAVVARMPRGIGRQVHRSHWVARRAVLGDRRVGREMRLQTVDGESVPVSGAQVGAVRAWLAQDGEVRITKREDRGDKR